MARRSPQLKHPLPERQCPHCQQWFVPYRQIQKYCNARCRNDYFWATHEIVEKPHEQLPKQETGT